MTGCVVQAMGACLGVPPAAPTAAQVEEVASLCCCQEQLPDPDAARRQMGALSPGLPGCLRLMEGLPLLAWWLHLRPAPQPQLGDELYLQVLARQVLGFTSSYGQIKG